jgi:hypothetical protein
MDYVRARFESLILEPLLQPLEHAFGEYGDIAVESFSDALARMLEKAHE